MGICIEDGTNGVSFSKYLDAVYSRAYLTQRAVLVGRFYSSFVEWKDNFSNALKIWNAEVESVNSEGAFDSDFLNNGYNLYSSFRRWDWRLALLARRFAYFFN